MVSCSVLPNECANAAAEYVDGSLEKFAEHMTARAKELGCKNTNFVNANGLFDENLSLIHI